MRLSHLFLLFALAGVCAAQDTTFSSGPQYLITSDSPLFLRPIATPSLSLSTPPASINSVVIEPSASPATSSPSAGLPNPDLTRIYWGGAEPSQAAGENVSEIEITSRAPSKPLPASFIDSGVTGMTDARSLRAQGYGVSLGETSSFWKAHKPHGNHVYTNADLQRLHGG